MHSVYLASRKGAKAQSRGMNRESRESPRMKGDNAGGSMRTCYAADLPLHYSRHSRDWRLLLFFFAPLRQALH
jgi:hypothetical protein